MYLLADCTFQEDGVRFDISYPYGAFFPLLSYIVDSGF